MEFSNNFKKKLNDSKVSGDYIENKFVKSFKKVIVHGYQTLNSKNEKNPT